MTLFLAICWVVVMLLWLLSMLGAVPDSARYSPWLGWFAILFVGLAVFLTGTGVIMVRP